MKRIIILMLLTLNALAQSQTKFVFNENGLTPTFITFRIDSISQENLYNKTLEWINKTYKYPERATETKAENENVKLTGIKENVIQADKRYFHLKYTIKISFKKGQYTFEPLKIQTKANSKYDMGWQLVDLKNGALFFKKGKVIKKTKSYVTDIPSVLNELSGNLYNYLKTGKDVP